jgi:hypothetical protein
MIGLIKLVLSANFIIGVIVGVLAVVGYLYSTGSELNWKK